MFSNKTYFVGQVGGNQLGVVAISGSSLVVSLGVALFASWKLTIVNFLFVPFVIVAGYVNNKNIKESAARTMATEEQGVKVCHRKMLCVRRDEVYICSHAYTYLPYH